MSDETIMPFDFPVENPTIIKVIGVGGGGGNAVNHMYKEGIHDVTFVVCNTDNQALAESPVPVKLQLGKEGLGAGNRPERAREAAEESIEDVKGMLNDGCKNGIYHCRNGRRYRNRCGSDHCQDSQRYGYPHRRYCYHSVPF